MQDVALEVWPEFLEDLPYHVRSDIGYSPLIEPSAQVALMRMVGHHHHGGHRVAEDLRRIKVGRAVVVLRHDDTVDCIPQPAPFLPLALAEITGILVKKSRDDRLRKVIAYHLIRVVNAVTVGKALDSLTIHAVVSSLQLREPGE